MEDNFWAHLPAKLFLNNLFAHDKKIEVLEEYLETVRKYFKAETQMADFENNSAEETKKLNKWVSNATKDKITKIFDKIPEDTTFVIINAIYFKGLSHSVITSLTDSLFRQLVRVFQRTQHKKRDLL